MTDLPPPSPPAVPPSGPTPVAEPERVLIVRLSHLGDVCHALPVYHALRRRHPEARLAWAVQPEFAPLLEGLPGLERLLRFDRGGGLRAWRDLGQGLRDFRPQWTVDAQGNLKSAAVTRLSRAPRRLGLARRDWREPLGALALTEQAEPSTAPHALDRAARLVERLDPGGPLDVRLPLHEEERESGRGTLQMHLPDRGRPRRLLHLSRPGDPRSWPDEHYVRLATYLARAGADVCLISGPAEERLGRDLATRLAGVDGVRHWVGQRGLRPFAATLAAAAEQGLRLLATDSGPCHVAVAAGLPVDLVAGPEDPSRTGPWPDPASGESPHRVFRADSRRTTDVLPATLFAALRP